MFLNFSDCYVTYFYFQSNFQGVCILYGETELEDNNFLVQESDSSNCNFPIYFSLFGLIVYGLLMGIYYMYAVCRSRTDPSIGYVNIIIVYGLMMAIYYMYAVCRSGTYLSVGYVNIIIVYGFIMAIYYMYAVCRLWTDPSIVYVNIIIVYGLMMAIYYMVADRPVNRVCKYYHCVWSHDGNIFMLSVSHGQTCQ